MSFRRISKLCLLTAIAGAVTGLGWDNVPAAPPSPTDAQPGTEVLTRGPVHEAFAETVSFDPEPGIVVPRPPPEAIEELPPEQQLEGANVDWIPGYWAWDDERSDYLWVSGIWRDLPPGRQWVPGYWGQDGQGFQWTSGYWADAQTSEIEYLPEPPQSAEVGPNISAPSSDHTWLPGSWVWQQNRYAWRPGFWAAVQPNWVWVPAYYVWTPRGYVYVDGYWDYALDRRGMLFAPVYFDAGIYTQPGFVYSPTMVIDLGVFANHLFLRPRYGHYYFGDYYAANYSNAGFYPWFSFHGNRGYDPIFAHQRWQHRQDSDWEGHNESDFQHRRDHEDARPPRTWAAQQELIAREPTLAKQGRAVARLLDEVTNSPDATTRFQPLDNAARQNVVRRGQDVSKFRGERQRLESKAAETPTATPDIKVGPARVKLPQSPIIGKSADQLGAERAPPQRHVIPNPDPNIEPQPRGRRGANPATTELQAKPARKLPQAELQQRTTRKLTAPLPTETITGQPPQAAPQQPKQEVPNAVPRGRRQAASKEQPPTESEEKPKTEPSAAPKN